MINAIVFCTHMGHCFTDCLRSNNAVLDEMGLADIAVKFHRNKYGVWCKAERSKSSVDNSCCTNNHQDVVEA